MESTAEHTLNPPRNEFRCFWDKCSSVFFVLTQFHHHVENHIEGNPIDLWSCKWLNCRHSNRFKHRYMLQRHLRTHTGELPFPCEYCPATFSTRENLIRHDCGHTGRLPYPCRKCNKRYARTSERLKCEAFHAGKKYLCSLCNKVYTDSGSLRRHKRRDHFEGEPSKPTPAPATDEWRKEENMNAEYQPMVENPDEMASEPALFSSSEMIAALPGDSESSDMKLAVQDVMQSVEPWILLPTPQEMSSDDVVSCAQQQCPPDIQDNVIDSACANLGFASATNTVSGPSAEEVSYIQYGVAPDTDDENRSFVNTTVDDGLCRYQNVSIVVPESSVINIELPTTNSPNYGTLTSFSGESNSNANMPVNLVCQNKYERPGEVVTEYTLPPIHTLTLTSFPKYFNEIPLQESDPTDNAGSLVISIDGALDLTSGHGMPASYGESEGGGRCGCGAIDLSISTEWTPEPGFSFTSLLNSNLPYDPIDLSSAAVPLSAVDTYE